MNRLFCFVLFASSTLLVFGNDGGSWDDYDEDDDDITTINSTTNGTIMFTDVLENVTVDAGTKLVRLVCEVQNLDVNNTDVKITFKWMKNFAPVERSKRVNFKTAKVKDVDHRFRSTLRIANVETLDMAFYDCVASNGVDKIRSQGMLQVGPDSKWGGDSTSSLHVPKFELEMTTSAVVTSGIFQPKIQAFPKKYELEDAIKSGRMQKTFDLTSSGEVATASRPVHKPPEPFCQIYSGKTCKTYLENKYVFVQAPFTQKEIEEKLINAFLVISQSNDISSSCNKFAHPSLCFSAFPLCVDPLQINIYQNDRANGRLKGGAPNNGSYQYIRNELAASLRRICKDDCLLLETELCSKEYAIAKRHPVIGQTLELEECQYLPDELEETSKNCLSLGVNRGVNKDDNCYWDDGQMYRGVQNVSTTGTTCLRWAHQFHIPLSEHPELTGHNYCRNPGGTSSRPFCYVDQNKKEMCDITKCAHVVAMYVIASFAAISAALAVIIGLFCCRRKNKTRNIQNISVPNADKNIYGNPGPNSPMEMNSLLPPNIPPQRHHHSSKNGYQNVLQYTYKEVAFIEELGEGAFGKVYKGELKAKTGKIFVAVKSLKENASAKTQADFQREIELISELKHPNIICLMGVVVKQEPMCMLFEFMSEGDLHEFLIANSPSEGRSLTQNQFLHIAIQIAQGMEYLSDNHYVHRDLAARNCLVSKDLVVKISDFGLSRDMYSCDYYRVQSKSLLPVRWMPPESILYGKFTTESDVWSYGVVLWEIYSYGLQPYYGYNNQEVINMIRSRKLLPPPDACPGYCYSLMVECWAELAIRRPSFGEISHRLRVWKQNGTSNGAYFKTPDHCAGPPSKYGHSSKSSHASDSPTVCAAESQVDSAAATWERPLTKSNRLNESQSSLTSRSSSLGNKTQSTSLSNNDSSNRHRRSHKRNEDSLDRINPKNTVVSSNGDNFEIKITH